MTPRPAGATGGALGPAVLGPAVLLLAAVAWAPASGQERLEELDPFVPRAMRTDADRARFAERLGLLARQLQRSWLIPGLDSGYVPRGIAWPGEPAEHALLAFQWRGYPPGRPAVVVLVDLAAGEVARRAELLERSGEPYRGRLGGIAVVGDFLYAGGDGLLRRYALGRLLELGAWGQLQAEACQRLDSQLSSLSAAGETLWAGEYRAGKRRPTLPHHHVAKHKAWAAAYPVDPRTGALRAPRSYQVEEAYDEELDPVVLQPERVVFLPERTQGFAACGPVIALTRGGGKTTELRLHAAPFAEEPLAVPLPGGGTVPGHILRPYATLELPSGAQDLAWTGDRLLVTYSSASRRFQRLRRFGHIIEDRFHELTLPPPPGLGKRELLAKRRFAVFSPETRRLSFSLVAEGVARARSLLSIGVGHAFDDSGDGGLEVALVDSAGREVLRKLLTTRPVVWIEHEVAVGSRWTLVIEDRDTELEGRYGGNGGTVQVWLAE